MCLYSEMIYSYFSLSHLYSFYEDGLAEKVKKIKIGFIFCKLENYLSDDVLLQTKGDTFFKREPNSLTDCLISKFLIFSFNFKTILAPILKR